MVETTASQDASDHFTTIEVARMLGMAVRSVQMMVDRGDLEAWKTPGGHRRISRQSVQRWLDDRAGDSSSPRVAHREAVPARPRQVRILVIEDSAHYQNLLSLLLKQQLPDADVQVADDGIAGLAMAGRLDPDILIVDILLPGIDGATLITSLRSHPQFRHSRLIVVTSLDEAQRAPYAFALSGVPVIHKTRIVAELPGMLASFLSPAGVGGTAN
jgi:excisionase family DNA binding protein